MIQKRGAKRKYGEETSTLTIRVPATRKKEINDLIKLILKKYTVKKDYMKVIVEVSGNDSLKLFNHIKGYAIEQVGQNRLLFQSKEDVRICFNKVARLIRIIEPEAAVKLAKDYSIISYNEAKAMY